MTWAEKLFFLSFQKCPNFYDSNNSDGSYGRLKVKNTFFVNLYLDERRKTFNDINIRIYGP